MKKIALTLCILTYLHPNTAFAVDFVVDSRSTQQNGGNTINGDDTLTITEEGSITTNGVDAVNATGANNSINNRGALITTGDASDGVQVVDSTTVTNSGRIQTNGIASQGIIFNDNNVIENRGTIHTLGVSSVGIIGEENNLVQNFGTITAVNTDSDGIFLLNNNTAFNFGTINVSGSGANGLRFNGGGNSFTNTGQLITTGPNGDVIQITSNNTINNSGVVIGYGVNSDGVAGSNSNTINNTGIMTITGGNARGVLLNNTNIVTNSGSIVSSQSNSIEFTGAGNTLNLQAPSFVGGAIDLGTSTTANLTTGASHSVIWNFSTGTLNGGLLNISGPVPSFYQTTTQQFATYDPSALSAAPDFLADVTEGTASTIANRLLYIDYRCEERCCLQPWVSAYGSHIDYNGNSTTLDSRIDYWNVLIGAEAQLPCQLTTGLLLGYGKGYYKAESPFYHSYNNDADGAVGGIYLRQMCQCAFFDVSFCAGNLYYSNNRFINDNLAAEGEGATATSDYNSWWITPQVALGANLHLNHSLVFIPRTSYRYAYQGVGSFDESNALANASVDSTHVQVGEWKIEGLLQRSNSFIDVSFKGGYLLRDPLGANEATVTLFGINQTIPSFANHHSCGYIGANGRLFVGSQWQVSAEGEHLFGYKMKGYRGLLNLAGTF